MATQVVLQACTAALYVPDKMASYEVELPGGGLAFYAQVGTYHMIENDEVTESDMATTAFMLDGAAPDIRPVTLAITGGPVTTSARLNLLALRPWRVPLL